MTPQKTHLETLDCYTVARFSLLWFPVTLHSGVYHSDSLSSEIKQQLDTLGRDFAYNRTPVYVIMSFGVTGFSVEAQYRHIYYYTAVLYCIYLNGLFFSSFISVSVT